MTDIERLIVDIDPRPSQAPRLRKVLTDYEAAVDAMRDYLAHDGSGIKRNDEWSGDFDALKLASARDRLRAALSSLRDEVTA